MAATAVQAAWSAKVTARGGEGVPRLSGRTFSRGRRGTVGVRRALRVTVKAGDDLEIPTKQNTAVHTPAFFQSDWARHREHLRFVRHFATWSRSAILRFVLPTVALITAETAALHFFAPATWSVPILPFNLTSFAMAMLVVFRTNTSYARWWEARILWGGTVNACRSLARETISSMYSVSPTLCQRGCRLIAAYVNILAAHLQGLSDERLRFVLSEKIAPAEVDVLMASKHKPGAALHAMSLVIRAARRRGEIDQLTHNHLAERLHNLTDGMGACERILRTPMPLSITRHTSRFMMVWLAGLPFALVPQLGALAIPVMAIITLLIVSIDEIGVNLEEPFRRLPLIDIADVIEASVKSYYDETTDMGLVMAQAPEPVEMMDRTPVNVDVY